MFQARQLFSQLGIGPGNSLLGGIAVLFMPVPVIFYKVGSNCLRYYLLSKLTVRQYGAKIRHMSKNARHDV